MLMIIEVKLVCLGGQEFAGELKASSLEASFHVETLGVWKIWKSTPGTNGEQDAARVPVCGSGRTGGSSTGCRRLPGGGSSCRKCSQWSELFKELGQLKDWMTRMFFSYENCHH